MKVAPIKVEYVDHMGSDLNVVNAARVSFDKVAESLGDGDRRLIAYLAKHNHWTPFAHTSLQLRIKAPLFVARQLVKHQVGLVWNEVSRRYVDSEPEFYIPTDFHGRPENKKQGASDTVMPESGEVFHAMYRHSETSLRLYNDMILIGVAPEEARMVLPLNTHTEWIWTGSAAAFARVINQRLDPHAQLATQEVAKGILNIAIQQFPVTIEALTNWTKD